MPRRSKYFVQDRAWRHRRRGRSWRPNLRERSAALRSALKRRREGPRLSLAPFADVLLVASACLLVVGLPFLYVWQGAKLQQLTAEREAARDELTQIEEINHALELRIEEGFSLKVLSEFAVLHGMVTPTKVSYVPVPTSERP